MSSNEISLHLKGLSQFVDDLPEPQNLLFALPFPSPVAHGRIRELDTSDALALDGIYAVLTARDIPGENQVGNIIQDEVMLADGEVHYVGQPVAVIVGESPEIVRRARRLIRADIEEWPAVFDAREAAEKNLLLTPTRTFAIGDVESAFSQCDVIVEGRVESGGQEHLYMETQTAMALPTEDGGVKIYSATQSASVVQRTVARVLGLEASRVEVEVPRLGGGFGGKEDQATPWACMAALAAHRLGRPVKLTLRRSEDMRYTGKRHPYSSDYKLGLTSDGKILAYEVTFYQNGGAAADLSPAIMERTLFHTTNSYYIPNVRSTAISCKTNLPPNTAFRGFGAPQAMFVMESALYHAASEMDIRPEILQKKNLVKNGNKMPYGQRLTNVSARTCWDGLLGKGQLALLKKEIKSYNREHVFKKAGYAVMPICFGISFTNTGLNQASSLVHVFGDGSASVTTGAVEMGQGVKEKIRGIVSRIFCLDRGRIKVEFTNTTRIANMSPTAASTGADLNGNATRLACERILARILKNESKQNDDKLVRFENGRFLIEGNAGGRSWEEAVLSAYWNRTSLSEHAFYATPKIHFDKSREKGQPFAYHVYGTAVVQADVDCLRGTYRIEKVRVLHDAGAPLHSKIDMGQMEGGIVQGLGWITMEEVQHDGSGRLVTDTLTTYKVPDIQFAPDMEITFLNRDNPVGLYRSKAVGEPPFMYGIAGYFALLDAMRAFDKNIVLRFEAPMTPERVLSWLYPDKEPEEITATSMPVAETVELPVK